MSVLINSNTGFWTWDTNWQTNNNIEFTPSFAYFEKDSVVVSLILADATTITVPASYYSISPSSPYKVIVNFLNFFNANGVASAATKAQVYIYRAVPYSITLPPTGSITPEMLYNELYRFLALIFDATSGGANIIPPPAVRAYSDFSFDINGSPIANKNYALRRWAIDFPHKANTWVEYNGGLYKVKNDITINGSTPDIDTTNYQCFIEPGGFVQKYNNLDRLIYSSTLTYLANETVVHNGHWWEATTTVNNVTPGFGVSQWRKTTVGVWFATYNYLTNENTLGSNGMLYRAKQNNSNQDPTTDTSQTYWEPVGSSSQSSSNFFADETFTGKATWTGTSTFAINTSSLLIGDNTEGRFTGVGYKETAITIPRAARGETIEISFDGNLGGTTPSVTLSLTDGAALPVAHNGAVITRLGKSRFFAKLIMTDNATLNFRFTFAGTSPDFRIQNLVVQREKTIYGPAIGPWQSYTPTFSAGLGTVTGIAMKYRDVPEGIEITGEFTTGTVSASVATMSLPSGKTSMSDYPAYEMVGTIKRNVTNSNTRNAIINASNSVISMSLDNNASAGQLTPTNGDVLFGSSERVSVGIIYIRTSQAQGKGIVQLVESAGTMYLSNVTPTVRSSVAGQTIEPSTGMNYYGVDGAPILGHSNSIVYYDIDLPRALLPNEVPQFELRSKIDGTWMKVEDARAWITGSGAFGLRMWDWLPTTTTGRTYGCGLVQSPNAGKLRVKFSGSAVNSFTSETLQNDTTTGGAIGWPTIASTYFDRWRVRVSPQNAVELPPKIVFRATKTANQAVTADVTAITFASILTDTQGIGNINGNVLVPKTGWARVGVNRLAGTATGDIKVYLDGVFSQVIGVVNATVPLAFNSLIYVTKGQTITLRYGQSATVQAYADTIFEMVFEGV